MNSRIRQLQSLFPKHKIDAYLTARDVNVSYLAGFPASESWLFVTKTKSYYLTDFRYVLEVRPQLRGIILKQYIRSRNETLFQTAAAARVKRIGFNPDEVTLAGYHQLKKACPSGTTLVACPPVIESLRAVKDFSEVNRIRRALDIHSEVLKMLRRIIVPGVTERQVLWKLEDFVRRKKVGFSFSPIIASGPNSCFPHAKVTDRKIRRNELVLVDIGIDYQGYKSDLTRIFFSGKIPHLVRKTYDLVAEAQHRAIKVIKAGVKIASVDQQARQFLEKHKLAKYFGHALGHGVGLEIHEAPRVSQQSRAVLEEGMVITVEPAVYLPNQFGIRIEDMVLVTKDGCKVLSSFIK